MYCLRRNSNFKSISAFVRLYSLGRKSHYEILNLRKNCTEKEIKEAFIQMSKEYHPDKNKDARAQEQFVRIVEAYNVLSKPGSRAQYDITTDIENNHTGSAYVYRTHVPYNLRNNPQYSYFYENQNKTNEASTEKKQKSYYGFEGVKRLPNTAIILICFGFGLVGLVVQMFVIRESFMANQKTSLERSARLADELDKVRSKARDNGNELQTRILLDKIVSAANPSVTTASLGQALASEKK